ncbi:MAG: flavin-containing monooxygenase [Solirubrobacteraceae bacterium]
MGHDDAKRGGEARLARRVCVIGAGTSGLAAIRELMCAGHEVHAYEAGSAVGGMWRYENDNGLSGAYQSLTANTSRKRMQYPSMPMPDSVPEYPSRSDMVAHLEAYARVNDLLSHIDFGAWLQDARPSDDGWEVTIAGRAPQHFDALVIASGHYWDPYIPELPGRFEGMVMHARDYRTPEQFSGRRVVVVGAGQSALDIVAEISSTAEQTILSCRDGHHLAPRSVFGQPLDSFDTAAALFVPIPLIRAGIHAMIAIARATPDRGDLPKPNHKLFQSRWPVIVSPALQTALSARAFQCRPRLEAFDGERVRFEDGSESQVDAILFATGYRINFPFLSARLGQGNGWEFPLYRRILSPRASGLAFIGVLEPGPGLFEIVERQATWLGEMLAGVLPIPDEQGMWKAIDAGGERRSRRQFATTGRHTILCSRHAYLRLLAKDLRTAR